MSLFPKKKKKKTEKPQNIFFIDIKLNVKLHLEETHFLTPVNLLLGELGMYFYVGALGSTIFFSSLFSSFFFPLP